MSGNPLREPPDVVRILIVDDDQRICGVYRRLVAAADREVYTCSTGREAIAYLEREPTELVLLDLNLPDLHGSAVLEWLTGNHPEIAVVVFSADDRIESAIQAQRLGAQGFVRKHADPDEVLHTVAEVLRGQRLKREHAMMTWRLEQSERLHRFLVEHSPDIIYTLDDAGRFVFINRRIESLLGYVPEELIGQHYSVLVHDGDREQTRYAFAERRSGERATFNHEVLLRCKQDHLRHFENRVVVAILCSRGIYRGRDGSSAPDYVGTSGVLRDITDRKKAEETIAFQAFHDLLTGLPNRKLFEDRLELAISHAKRREHRVAVMYLDIDRFKQVNDCFGHAEGDALLCNFAHRVRACLREGDTMSRQGGDEFTILLPDLSESAAALTIARKIMAELDHPFRVAGRDLCATASIGIAVYPQDGECAATLMRNADTAMYHIKSRGRNGFLEYDRVMGVANAGRIDLEHELRRALEQGMLELYYQPQISLRQGRVVGFEALVRWNHPARGLVGPNDFIPVAEECGLIFGVSDWVLDEACRQLSRWSDAGHRETMLAVNISAVEFERADFVDRVMQPIERHGVDPGRVEIEITESLLMVNAEQVIDRVAQLRQRGVRVSIDDFGTRYSSLNYLRRFRASSVKIDQSFVRDIENGEESSPVIGAIVGIARGFALEVVAEGVETDAQARALSRLGCDQMQGYRFSRPLPAHLLEDFLAAPERLRSLCRQLAGASASGAGRQDALLQT